MSLYTEKWRRNFGCGIRRIEKGRRKLATDMAPEEKLALAGPTGDTGSRWAE